MPGHGRRRRARGREGCPRVEVGWGWAPVEGLQGQLAQLCGGVQCEAQLQGALGEHVAQPVQHLGGSTVAGGEREGVRSLLWRYSGGVHAVASRVATCWQLCTGCGSGVTHPEPLGNCRQHMEALILVADTLTEHTPTWLMRCAMRLSGSMMATTSSSAPEPAPSCSVVLLVSRSMALDTMAA